VLTANDPFPALHAALEEVRGDAGYFWDNARRAAVDRFVIQMTMEGAGFFEDAAGRREVPAGHAMLFVHGEESRYGFPAGASGSYRLRFIGFAPGFLRGLFEHLRQSFGAVLRMPVRSPSEILFTELFERFHERSFVDRFQQAQLLSALLLELYRGQVSVQREEDPIEYGRHLLRDHYRSPVNLKTLADLCGVSREHFSREFRRRFQTSPSKLLRQLRLSQACSMLQGTDMPVEEVALACGFTSSHSFGRVFRQYYRLQPSVYRSRSR
jgi:AraC-like DNA-binding protein